MTGTTAGGKKTAMGGTGDPHKASPAAVEHYIKGAHFPADRDELIELASDNNAPDDVMDVLNNFSDQEYGSVIDVAREVGRIDARAQDGRQGSSSSSKSSSHRDSNKDRNEERGDRPDDRSNKERAK